MAWVECECPPTAIWALGQETGRSREATVGGLLRAPVMRRFVDNSQEKDNARVGHGIGEPQDATAHDGIAEVEH